MCALHDHFGNHHRLVAAQFEISRLLQNFKCGLFQLKQLRG
jgi:hypothetical protein